MCLGACTCTVVACFFSYCGNNVPRHFHSYSSIPYCEMNWLEFISGRFQSDSKNPGWCSSSSQSLKPNFQLFELKFFIFHIIIIFFSFAGRACRSTSSESDDAIPLEPLDLIWAKCRGYPWYPALVSTTPASAMMNGQSGHRALLNVSSCLLTSPIYL